MRKTLRIYGKTGVTIIPEIHYGPGDVIEAIHVMMECNHGFMSEILMPEDAFRLGRELIKLSGVSYNTVDFVKSLRDEWEEKENAIWDKEETK